MPREQIPFGPESPENYSEETEKLIARLMGQKGYSRADAVRVVQASQNINKIKEKKLNGADRAQALEDGDDRLR
jgi:hypothetical protein